MKWSDRFHERFRISSLTCIAIEMSAVLGAFVSVNQRCRIRTV